VAAAITAAQTPAEIPALLVGIDAYGGDLMGFGERRGAAGKQAAEGTEARDHGELVAGPADEWVRFRAYGNQLIETHIRLRELLDDLREGIVPQADLGAYCMAFCEAVTRHHTAEDTTVFPVLAERHPELRAFLAELERDHYVIAGLLRSLSAAGTPGREDLDALAAVLETHFRGEEKRLAGVLNALDPSLGPLGLEE
jgi:hypothetical protein